jgi:hypothetical protein
MWGTTLKMQTKMKSTQLIFNEAAPVPLSIYAVETGKKSIRQRKIESAEMSLLSTVVCCTPLDQKRSQDIRAERKVFNLTERIERQKKNLYEHILRMTADRLRKILLNLKARGL